MSEVNYVVNFTDEVENVVQFGSEVNYRISTMNIRRNRTMIFRVELRKFRSGLNDLYNL